MKKRIYRNMLLLVVTTIILSTLLTTVTLYRGIYNRMQQEVRNEAFFLSVAYNNIGEGLFTDLAGKESSSRVTWINSEGRVLFDNVSNVESMENHSLGQKFLMPYDMVMEKLCINLKLWMNKHFTELLN